MQVHEPLEPIIVNGNGRTPILLTCEHATRYLPPLLGGLGLSEHVLDGHGAWDLGAYSFANEIVRLLDAPLVAAPASRLLIDPNRALDAPDLIPQRIEDILVPGNLHISDAERTARITAYHTPYHDGISRLLRGRPEIQGLVSIHSFTPTFLGKSRPWHIGVLCRSDRRLADAVLTRLNTETSLTVGLNEPYAPSQGVYYTLDRHADGRPTAMIEIRNDFMTGKGKRKLIARILVDSLRKWLSSQEKIHSNR